MLQVVCVGCEMCLLLGRLLCRWFLCQKSKTCLRVCDCVVVSGVVCAVKIGQDAKLGSVRWFVRNTSGETGQASVVSRGPVSPTPHSPLPANIMPPAPLRHISAGQSWLGLCYCWGLCIVFVIYCLDLVLRVAEDKEFGTPASLLSSGIPQMSPKVSPIGLWLLHVTHTLTHTIPL
jgi:hypothetical protein